MTSPIGNPKFTPKLNSWAFILNIAEITKNDTNNNFLEILVYLDSIIEKKPTSGEFDMNKLLMYTAGFTGAQLELLGKEASFYCLRHGLPAITQDILIDQLNNIKYG
ncbi:MAG: hypothetical protein B7Z06_07985, partial [Flavobacteriales bacterium 32-35-8]